MSIFMVLNFGTIKFECSDGDYTVRYFKFIESNSSIDYNYQ